MTAEVYDPQSGIFSATGAAGSWTGWGLRLPNDKILFAGSPVQIYDPQAGTFSSLGFSAGIFGFLPDKRVLILSGSIAKIYNPETGDVSIAGPQAVQMPSSCSYTMLKDGRLLISGYYSIDNMFFHTFLYSKADIFDPATGLITATGNMNWPRYGYSSQVLSDGRVLIIGGKVQTRFGDWVTYPIDTAEIYDPVLGQFFPTAPMPVARMNHTATALMDADKTVLIVGGQDANQLWAGAILFDRANRRFLADEYMNLITNRYYHTATLLADGRVLIAGGTGNGSTVLTSAELWQ